MRVIKDNSGREYRVKCKNCKSHIAYKVADARIKWGTGKRYIRCPLCTEEITIHRSFRYSVGA